jgi:Putative prokaryotic signal transducing protein
MSDEISVLKVFDNEMEASMAQQVLENAGINATLQKDDAGGIVPSLQLTGGVSLIVNQADEERAAEVLTDFLNSAETVD